MSVFKFRDEVNQLTDALEKNTIKLSAWTRIELRHFREEETDAIFELLETIKNQTQKISDLIRREDER